MQYISKILDLSLKFDKKENISDDVIRYIDFDFAKLKRKKKLTKSYVFMLTEVAISYSFKF